MGTSSVGQRPEVILNRDRKPLVTTWSWGGEGEEEEGGALWQLNGSVSWLQWWLRESAPVRKWHAL